MRDVRGSLRVVAVALLALSSATGGLAAPYQMRLGYLNDGTFGEASQGDTAMALSMWGTEIAAGLRTSITPKAVGYARAADLAASTLAGTTTIMVMDCYYFVTLKSCASLRPSLMGLAGGAPTVTYVLLVHRKKGVRSLSQLGRRSVEVGSRASQMLPSVWLETIVGQNRLGHCSTFFRSVRSAKNASKAMLDVFFGSADACVVSSRAYAQATELNPQIGQQLQPVKTSSQYLELVMCISPRAPRNIVPLILKGAYALHTGARGRQLLALFGQEKVVPYKPEYLSATRSLVRAYQASGGKPR